METLTRTREQQRSTAAGSSGAAAETNEWSAADALRVAAAAREAMSRALSTDSEEFVRSSAQRGGE